MNFIPEKFDAFILGAGPAGLCAAIRLLQMGHRVGLLEQKEFPRPQIGESLSPGIFNIFDFLQAGNLLNDPLFIKGIPSNVIWETKEQVYNNSSQKASGIIVDRGLLDGALLRFAIHKGLYVMQPAKLRASMPADDGWRLEIQHNEGLKKIFCSVVLDARGRRGALACDRVEIAPASVASWVHVSEGCMPAESLIEAVEEGWLWGSPVPGKKFRIMAFTHGSCLKNSYRSILGTLVKKTTLFSAFAGELKKSREATCSVTSFVNRQPWNRQFIKIGEAAFTLDPLSSSGVEKAMRFSMQTAIAVNTYLKRRDHAIPKDFYEKKIIESVVHHAHWTREFYTAAWASKSGSAFWDSRADFQLQFSTDASAFLLKLQHAFNEPVSKPVFHQSPAMPIDLFLQQLTHERLYLSPLIEFKNEYAVQNDCIELTQAILHPNLQRPVIYIDDVALKPMLQQTAGRTVLDAIDNLSKRMPLEKAKRLIFFIWQQQLVHT